MAKKTTSEILLIYAEKLKNGEVPPYTKTVLDKCIRGIDQKLDLWKDKLSDHDASEPESESAQEKWEEAGERLEDRVDRLEDILGALETILSLLRESDENAKEAGRDLESVVEDIDKYNYEYKGLKYVIE